jgi:4-diphosphocytidyl-2-C-methyl-D-erythritol kinase
VPPLTVIERAHAKINLDLAVGARRPDGFHDVQTVLQALDLHDTIRFETTRAPFRLEGDAALMPLDRSNLIWRAAEALWRAGGRAGQLRGVRVSVVKRTPSQAGLGGGSSDAAAALAGLNRLWRLGLSTRELAGIAEPLGADVPFFLYGGTALGLGRGERIFPLADLPTRFVVLALPSVGVATPDAYRWLAEERAAGRSAPRRPLDWRAMPDGGENDFEPVVEARHPEIAEARRRLLSSGAEVARLSGSGSAVFGLFARAGEAGRAVRLLSEAGCRAVVTRTRRRTAAESRRVV